MADEVLAASVLLGKEEQRRFSSVMACFCVYVFLCLISHRLHILQCFGNRRQRYYDHCSDQLRQDVGGIVSQSVYHGIHAFRRIGCEEYVTGDHVADVAAKDTNDNAGGQSIFLIGEEAGHTQSTEGQRVVQKYLQRRVDIGSKAQLQNTVGHTGHDTDFRAVQVTDKADEKHAEQGDGAAHGQTGKFDKAGDQSQSHGNGTECQLFGAHFFAVFAGQDKGNDKRCQHQDDEGNVTGGGQIVFPVFRVIS